MIKQKRKREKEYNLVFIDLAKAFKTVSHKSIDKGLRRKGIPEQVREAVMKMYSGATTRISVRGKVTRQTRIRAGVMKGCPLSPLLFNSIIDELLEKLKKLKVGIKIREELCAAWLSQMIWCYSQKKGSICRYWSRQVRSFWTGKDWRHAGKCVSLRVVPVPKKKSMKVITKSHTQCGTENIPSITLKDLVKYLGVEIQPDRTVKLPRELWIDTSKTFRKLTWTLSKR